MLRVGLTLTISASIFASFLATGCGGGGMPLHPHPYEISTFAIGGGQADGTGYVALTEGQEVSLISGAQGGFHVYVNARFNMMSAAALPDSVVFDRQARVEKSGELVSTTKERRTVVRSSGQDGSFEIERPMPMFLCPAPVGIKVEEVSIVLHVRALADDNSEDALAEGTIKLTPRCPDGDLASFCHRICSG